MSVWIVLEWFHTGPHIRGVFAERHEAVTWLEVEASLLEVPLVLSPGHGYYLEGFQFSIREYPILTTPYIPPTVHDRPGGDE